MREYGTLIQGKWNESETFEYRHASNKEYGLFACLPKLRRGLFIALPFSRFSETDPPETLPPLAWVAEYLLAVKLSTRRRHRDCARLADSVSGGPSTDHFASQRMCGNLTYALALKQGRQGWRRSPPSLSSSGSLSVSSRCAAPRLASSCSSRT